MKQQLDQARPALEREVLRQFGWKPDVYRLEARQFDDTSGVLVVAVVHLDDLRNPSPGGGKSWRADFDTRQTKVVRWLKYQ